MDYRKFEFESDGNQYVLWMWKGDYLNLGAGAEIGIYTGGGPHWQVDTSLAMNMSMKLDYKNTTIACWSQKHWWLTSFNPEYQSVDPVDLTVEFVVEFNSFQMYNDFRNNAIGWMLDDESMTASYSF